MGAEYAKRILVHYLRKMFEWANFPWDPDCGAEIEAAVDAIVEEAVARAKKEMSK